MAERRRLFARVQSFILDNIQVRYDRELGHGSYATVLEVEYMGLKCAGKKIHNVLQTHEAYSVHRFEEECTLLSQLRHPNVVQFLGVFFEEEAQIPMLVMEFLPTNLSSCIEKYKVLPNEINYSILHDVSLGLCYLHSQTPPIIHRDLSSNNVLLTPNMTAKIADLGVARILNLTPLQVSCMTQTPGTPAYMPPEVMVANPKYDTSVDVFSYGILMIHMFSGRWPEPQVGPNRVEKGKLIPVTEAERREKFLKICDRHQSLVPLILKCIHNDPFERPHLKTIVKKQAEMVFTFPSSFTNRLELLRHIQASDAAIASLKKKLSSLEASLLSKERQPGSIKWKSCANLPISMNSGHATLIEGKVYYGGGLTDHKVEDGIIADNIVHCYDHLQDHWTALPPLKVKCFGLGRINNELVAIGGVSKSFQDRQIHPEVYTFDKKVWQWKERMPPLLTARCFHGVISLQSALIVVGGQVSSPTENTSYTNTVEVFKCDERKWYRTNPLPVYLFNLSVTCHQDTCYVLGGFRNRPLNEAYYADISDLLSNALLPDKGKSDEKESEKTVWKSLPNTPTAQPASTILTGELIAVGGSKGNPVREAKTSVYRFSSLSDSWECIGNLPSERRLVTAVSLSPLEVLVVGGRVQDKDTDTVYIGHLQTQ